MWIRNRAIILTAYRLSNRIPHLNNKAGINPDYYVGMSRPIFRYALQYVRLQTLGNIGFYRDLNIFMTKSLKC